MDLKVASAQLATSRTAASSSADTQPYSLVEQVDLCLQVQFGEQIEQMPEGEMRFGLRGGKMKLLLRGCEMSSTHPEVIHLPETNILITRVTEAGADEPISSEKPVWSFEEKLGEPILKGQLQEVVLGSLNIPVKPYRIEAVFEVLLKDVKLMAAEKTGFEALPPARQKIAKLGLENLLLSNKLQPHVSRVELLEGL